MADGDSNICERCGALFTCDASNISNCSCSQIILSLVAREYIKQTFDDCLCVACLQEINLTFKPTNE